MASPDLLKGLAKQFLAPEKIGTTLAMLEERLEDAMEAKDIVQTLAISQLITETKKIQAKQSAPAPEPAKKK